MLERFGGTAGFLTTRLQCAGRGVDAVILSLHNEMQ